MKTKKTKKSQVLYQKMILGGLTLKDVYNLVEKETYAIEVDGYSRTCFAFDNDELSLWEDEYEDPDVFPGNIKVKIVDGTTVEFDYEGETYTLNFMRCENINIKNKIMP